MHRSRICGAPIVSPVAFVTCGLWRSNTLETAMGYDAVLPTVFLFSALSLSSVIFRFIRIVVVSICAKKLSAALIIRLFLLISVYAFDCPFSWLSYV
jgi:hypothetical protein